MNIRMDNTNLCHSSPDVKNLTRLPDKEYFKYGCQSTDLERKERLWCLALLLAHESGQLEFTEFSYNVSEVLTH